MTVYELFGDAEPEDAWHPDDPPEVLIDNLERRLQAIAGWKFAPAGKRLERRWELLEVITHRMLRKGELSPAEALRLHAVTVDLEHVRRRLEVS